MIDYYINGNEVYSIEFILLFIKTLNELLINLKNVNNLKVMFEASILSFVGKNSNSVSVSKEENNNNGFIKVKEEVFVKKVEQVENKPKIN